MANATDTSARWQRFFGHSDYVRFASVILSPARTAAELGGLKRLVRLGIGTRVLDLGCGYGRFSVPLAHAGSAVTALDGSGEQLRLARAAAARAAVEIEFVHGNMLELDRVETFDVVLCLGTALGYVEDADADLRIIAAIERALVPGGTVLIDTEGGGPKLRAPGSMDFEMAGMSVHSDRAFDPGTGRWHEHLSWSRNGERDSADYSLRLYSDVELCELLEQQGLSVDGAWGSLAGEPLQADSSRLVVRAHKPDAAGARAPALRATERDRRPSAPSPSDRD